MKTISGKEFIIAGAIGFFVGLRILGAGLGILYLAAALICIYFAFKNDVYRLFTLLPYVVYTEVFIRNGAGVTYVPYLFMEYLLIGIFLLMLLRRSGQLKLHSRSVLFIFLYAIIETLDMIRANDITYARSMVTFTYVLLAITLWASANTFSPKLTAHIIKHLALAGVFLAGNMLVAHFTHNITYSSVSSSEATNRMAPVQISGYLGICTSMIFLYIMNEKNRQRFITYLCVFVIVVTLMVLTFSRGGLYFLCSVIALYSLFNWKHIGKLAIFILFIPIGYIVYYYAMNATDGKIEPRYADESNSGRSALVEAGFELFAAEPLIGVGTGNYGKEALRRDLYTIESGAHNEFIRAAAEHGILGILFYWGFFIVIVFELLLRNKREREPAFYFLLLFTLITVHNGLKIAVQPYLLCIILATPTLTRFISKKHAAVPVHTAITTT